MKYWNDKPYYSLNYYYQQHFGTKVYKIALNAGLTCPNRDGSIDTRGCIFCSEGGSGDFASQPALSITNQIRTGKELLSNKVTNAKYIAYFQAFTNTYGNLEHLRSLYTEAMSDPQIVGISIATRPDCLSDDVLDLLEEMNQRKKVFIELGLQTKHEKSADFIRRGYPLSVFEHSVRKLHKRQIDTVVHLILGLPNETKKDILSSVSYISTLPIQGVKLQMLHILKNTDLATLYEKKPFPMLSLKEYTNLIIDSIEIIPEDMVIHRITGDGPKNLLIAPLWTTNKKNVLNTIHKQFKIRSSFQGKNYNIL